MMFLKQFYHQWLILPATLVTAGTVTMFFVLPIQVVVGYVKAADTSCVRRVRTSVGALLGLLLVGLYGAAGASMVKSPGKDFRKAFDRPPYGVWWCATVLIFIQTYVLR